MTCPVSEQASQEVDVPQGSSGHSRSVRSCVVMLEDEHMAKLLSQRNNVRNQNFLDIAFACHGTLDTNKSCAPFEHDSSSQHHAASSVPVVLRDTGIKKPLTR